MAARVRELAGAGPTAEELAAITADALARTREDMTAADIRRLAVTALTLSQQAAFLLGKLAALTGDGAGEPDV
jgi:hypothetical protein